MFPLEENFFRLVISLSIRKLLSISEHAWIIYSHEGVRLDSFIVILTRWRSAWWSNSYRIFQNYERRIRLNGKKKGYRNKNAWVYFVKRIRTLEVDTSCLKGPYLEGVSFKSPLPKYKATHPVLPFLTTCNWKIGISWGKDQYVLLIMGDAFWVYVRSVLEIYFPKYPPNTILSALLIFNYLNSLFLSWTHPY